MIYIQQGYSENLLKIKFKFSVDYETYVSECLMAIKSITYNKYDMLTNKNSKFLFHHFNGYLDRQLRPTERVRHTIISEGE